MTLLSLCAYYIRPTSISNLSIWQKITEVTFFQHLQTLFIFITFYVF